MTQLCLQRFFVFSSQKRPRGNVLSFWAIYGLLMTTLKWGPICEPPIYDLLSPLKVADPQ